MVKQEVVPVFPLVPPGFEHLIPPNSAAAAAIEPPRIQNENRIRLKRNMSDILEDHPVQRQWTASQYTLQEKENGVLSTRPQGHYEPVQLTNAQSSSHPINEATTINSSVVKIMNGGIDLNILKYVADALKYMNVSSSFFERNLVHTLMAIDKRYGDITKDCSLASDCMRSFVLMGICKVVRDLEKKRLEDLADISTLDSYYTAVMDAEIINVNVQWLHKRLDEIKDALTSYAEAKRMVNERNARLVNIDRTKKQLLLRRTNVRERIKSHEVEEEMEGWLRQEAVVVQELCKNVDDHMSRISQFQRKNLMDGVL